MDNVGLALVVLMRRVLGNRTMQNKALPLVSPPLAALLSDSAGKSIEQN
jgi:hypothetical protein